MSYTITFAIEIADFEDIVEALHNEARRYALMNAGDEGRRFIRISEKMNRQRTTIELIAAAKAHRRAKMHAAMKANEPYITVGSSMNDDRPTFSRTLKLH